MSNNTCISYFNQYTQGNVPFRQKNYYGSNLESEGGCDDWYCSDAKEYECMGIGYTEPVYDSSTNVLETPGIPYYLSLDNWKSKWSDGFCLQTFQEIITGSATGSVFNSFDPVGFKYVRDDFTFMFSRYFNHGINTNTERISNVPAPNTYLIPEGKIPFVWDNNTGVVISATVASSISFDNPLTITFTVNTIGPFQVKDAIVIYNVGTAGNVKGAAINATPSYPTTNSLFGNIQSITPIPNSSNTASQQYNIVVNITSLTGSFVATQYGFAFAYNPILSPFGNVWIGSSFNLTENSNDVGYDPFIGTLLSACKAMPGVCEPIQSYMCNVCSRDQITTSNTFIKFCGCVAPADPNVFYNDILKNYDPSCEPLCNNTLAIKNVNTTTGITEQCNANVCVMNNITINSVDTDFGQNPSFTQVCPSCADGTGNCVCIIDATFSNINGVDDYNGNNINDLARFNQVCPDALCFIVDPETGQYVEKQCEDSLYDTKTGKLLKTIDEGPAVKFPVWIAVIAGIFLLFIVLVFMAYKYQSDNIKVVYVSKIPIYN